MTIDLKAASDEIAKTLAEIAAEEAELEQRLAEEFPKAHRAARQAYDEFVGEDDAIEEDWEEVED